MGIDIVLYDNTFPCVVHHTQIKLGKNKSLICSKCVPLHRSPIVLGNTVSFCVHPTHIVLGIHIPLFGKRSSFFQNSRIVFLIVCIPSLLKISRERRIPDKEGQEKNRKDEQSFHTRMMTQIGGDVESGPHWAHLADFHTRKFQPYPFQIRGVFDRGGMDGDRGVMVITWKGK